MSLVRFRVRAPLFKEPSLWLGFCISAAGLSIELGSIIRRQRLTPSGPARQARRSTPSALVRVRAPLFKEPAQKAGFCFSASGLFIELHSMIPYPAALRLRGPTLFEPAGGPVGRIRHLCRHPAQPRVRCLMCIARRRCACAGLRCLNLWRTRRPDKAKPSGKRREERHYSAAVFPLPGSLNASP